MEKITKQLQYLFTASIALLVLVVIAGTNGYLTPEITFQANGKYLLQLLSITTLALIPASIAFFNKRMAICNNKEEGATAKEYLNAGTVRLLLTTVGTAVSSIVYFMIDDESALYCAIICAAAHIYNFPTKRIAQQIEENSNK
ncbi:MAG: hypothetical protein IKD40_06480 [Bacteroidaceae bacterium]|nr:hypothetical protein [Bacteroidaceae bacterium]